jgi:hypothetical protein
MSVVEFLESNGFLKMPLDNGTDSYHNIFTFGGTRYLVSVIIENNGTYTFHQSHRIYSDTRTATHRMAYITEQLLMSTLERFVK